MVKNEVDIAADDKSRLWLAQTSVAVSVVLFGLKYWAYYVTHSQVILSDALETIVNILASMIALWVIHWASQPADKEHPYGHGKAELLSAYFEGGLVFSAAVFIFIQAALSFSRPTELESLGVGLYITAGAGLINGVLGWVLVARGKKLRSSALVASGYHVLSDLITSIGVLLGVSIVMVTGLTVIDSLFAVLVALYLAYTGFRVMRSAIGGLLDKVDTEALQQLHKVINTQKHEGIIHVHHVRMMTSGDYNHLDAHVVVPEHWDVQKAHQATAEYEDHIFASLKRKGEAHFHIDPCERKYCESCSYKNCPVRQDEFLGYREITLEEMLSPEKHSN